MGTRLPLRLLYTMAVILAALAMLFLILTMVLKVSDLPGCPGYPIWAVVFSPEDDKLVSYDYDLRIWPVGEEF